MTTASIAPAPMPTNSETNPNTEEKSIRSSRRGKRSKSRDTNHSNNQNSLDGNAPSTPETDSDPNVGMHPPVHIQDHPRPVSPMDLTSEEVKSEKVGDYQNVVSVVPPDDDSDDEELKQDVYIPLKEEGDHDGHYDDPYVYSDDSESLSDAYFHPQQERRHSSPSYLFNRPYQNPYHHHKVTPPSESLAPGEGIFPAPRMHHQSYVPRQRHSLTDALMPPGRARLNHHDRSVLPTYGSIQLASETEQPKSPIYLHASVTPESYASPLTPPQNSSFSGGTILEDYPVDVDNHDEFYLTYSAKLQDNESSHPQSKMDKYQRKRRKRKLRRQHQYSDRDAAEEHQRKQQQQYAREHAVTQVRGKQQTMQTCNDSLFALLFIIQFLFVVVCAIHNGYELMLHPALLSSENMTHSSGLNWPFYGSATSINLGPSPSPANGMSMGTALTIDQADDFGGNSTTSSVVNRATDRFSHYDDDGGSLFVDDDDMVAIVDHTPVENGSILKANATSSPPSQIQESHVASFSIDYQNVIKLLCASGVYACMISYLTFGFMLIVARSLIQIILIFTVVLALAWGLLGMTFSDPGGLISVVGFSALALAIGYAVYSWHRIPFASTNLYIALCAMRCTADIVLLGTSALALSFLWFLVWSIAIIGVVNKGNSSDCLQADHCETHIKTNRWHVLIYGLFIFSFYWTNMVIKNIVRVTVASTIGTWWFTPSEIGPCCTQAVRRPLIRSFTTSFGSICLGSIATLPAQTISLLCNLFCWFLGVGECREVAAATQSGECDSSIASVTDSLALSEQSSERTKDMETTFLYRIGRNLRCYNRWSYTYIGMYGYTFAEGGEKAIQLFETREWMEVVRDNLIQNILLIATVVIGGSTGTFAVIVEEVDGFEFTTLHKPILTSCLLGSVLGFVLSNVLLLGVVGSAVNTVLVCFAAGPFEFDKNHPRYSREMRESWSQQVWEPSAESTSTTV